MKRLVVLGAGTAGTMAVNKLRHRLPAEWQITVVDQDTAHLYQPGLLLLPFGGAGAVHAAGGPAGRNPWWAPLQDYSDAARIGATL